MNPEPPLEKNAFVRFGRMLGPCSQKVESRLGVWMMFLAGKERIGIWLVEVYKVPEPVNLIRRKFGHSEASTKNI